MTDNLQRPKIFAADLNFVELDESKGDVEIVTSPKVKEEDLPLSAYSPFKEGEEVIHLTNDIPNHAFASPVPTQKKEPTADTIKEETTNTQEDNSEKSVYDDLQELSFVDIYSFNNYSEKFRKSHKYSPTINETWELVEFPSNCIFYDVDGIYVKPLTVRSLSKISGALQSKNFTQLLDILNMHINIDIRDLTTQDFKFFMIWLRLKSFPQSELTLDWVSRYGNKNSTIVRETALEFEKIDTTIKDVKEYALNYHLTYPTVRELEYQTINNLSPEDRWLFDYAKYYVGNDPDEKINNFNLHSSTFDSDISKFREKFKHGMEEYVYVVDQFFDREKYLSELKQKLDYLRKHANYLETKQHLNNSEIEEYNTTCEMIGVFEAEQYNIEQNVNMVAEEEKILLPFRPINLLPNIHLTDDSE